MAGRLGEEAGAGLVARVGREQPQRRSEDREALYPDRASASRVHNMQTLTYRRSEDECAGISKFWYILLQIVTFFRKVIVVLP